ncbi:MAG: T9SS type A sorting domain-containing protein, partial [Bacteroidales bacterium]|nr:T9SS type A sorting domain-containing protein [Bacteroidales bacterium]
FEELGYDYTLGEGDAKLSEKPIRWDFYNVTDRRNLFDNFKALIDIRKKYETFSSNNFTLYQTGKLKRLNVVHADMDAVVVGNFDVVAGGINGSFTRVGKWYEFFSGDSIDITASTQHQNLDLLPGEYRLYTSKRIARPSFLLGIDDPIIPGGDEEMTFKVYPNPFNENTLISFTGGDAYKPHLVEIFAADGTPVRIMAVPAGIKETIWNGQTGGGIEASAGIYLIRVTINGERYVRRIIKF